MAGAATRPSLGKATASHMYHLPRDMALIKLLYKILRYRNIFIFIYISLFLTRYREILSFIATRNFSHLFYFITHWRSYATTISTALLKNVLHA